MEALGSITSSNPQSAISYPSDLKTSMWHTYLSCKIEIGVNVIESFQKLSKFICGTADNNS